MNLEDHEHEPPSRSDWCCSQNFRTDLNNVMFDAIYFRLFFVFILYYINKASKYSLQGFILNYTENSLALRVSCSTFLF